MNDEYLPDYIKENYEVFGRFRFDHLFKKLLADGYDNEAAKDIILNNCALSLLVLQERIDNGYYRNMSPSDGIAPDLLTMLHEELMKVAYRWN